MDESLTKELIALAMNSGVVLAVVQLLKVKVLPWLKTNAPWSIPLIAGGIGLASSAIMAATGIDISLIAGVFSGFAASGMFAIVKEARG